MYIDCNVCKYVQKKFGFDNLLCVTNTKACVCFDMFGQFFLPFSSVHMYCRVTSLEQLSVAEFSGE